LKYGERREPEDIELAADAGEILVDLFYLTQHRWWDRQHEA